MFRSRSFLHGNAWFVVHNAGVRMRSGRSSGCGRGPSGMTQPSGPSAARRITTPAEPWGQCSRSSSRTKSGGMRTCTGPPSSALFASILAATAVEDQLCSAAFELHRAQGLLITHAPHASILGSPRIPLDKSIPAKEEHFCDEFNTTAGCPRSTSECPDLHACKVCKASGHGMQGFSSTGPGTPPLSSSNWQGEVG